MKKNLRKEIAEKDLMELQKMVSNAYDSLMRLRFDHAQGKLKNLRSLFNKRKELAYLKTLIRRKELKP